MMITTPFVGTETTAQRHARLKAITDWYFGAGAYVAAGTIGGAFGLLNTLMSVPAVDREVFASWAPKVNILNDPDVALPQQLFAGSVGVMLDPAQLASLSQDAAGTVPVTAAGQPVGRVLDRSGGGRNASQATSAARPTYRIDGGGRPYLEFDGVDDWLATASMTLAAGGRTVVAALRKRSDANIGTVAETGPDWSATPGAIGLIAPAMPATANYGARTRPAASPANLDSDASFAAPHTAVFTLRQATGTHVLRVNGAAVSAPQPDTIAAITAPVNIGARSSGSRFGAIDIYGLIVIDRALTDAELTRAEAWAAAKCGVTL